MCRATSRSIRFHGSTLFHVVWNLTLKAMFPFPGNAIRQMRGYGRATRGIYGDPNIHLVRSSHCGSPECQCACNLGGEGEHDLDYEPFDIAKVECSMGPGWGREYCRGHRDPGRRLDLHADARRSCG